MRKPALLALSTAVLALVGTAVWLIWFRDTIPKLEPDPSVQYTPPADAPSTAAPGEWPQWRGPNRNSTSLESDWSSTWPADGPPKLWRAQIGAGYAAVAVSKGKLYALGNADGKDTLRCLDAETGKEVWTLSHPERLESGGYPGPRATPTVDAGRVYTLSLGGELRCVDAEKGTLLWSHHLVKEVKAKLPQWGAASSPLIEGNLVIVFGGGKAEVAAFEKTSGKLAWTALEEPGGYASPVAFTHQGQRALGVLTGRTLVALDFTHGTELFRQTFKNGNEINASDPIFAEGQVFVANGYNGKSALLQLGAGAPAVVWENQELMIHFNTAVRHEGYLYGTSGQVNASGGAFKCIDWKTGAVAWSKENLFASALRAGNRLVLLERNGALVVAEASPKAYKELARAQVLGGECWTMPVLANGRIYVRNKTGELVCLDVRAAK